MEWAEEELKAGKLANITDASHKEPDLTGLSCQWGPVKSSKGKIISLIVKQAAGSTAKHFEEATRKIVLALKKSKAVNPVHETGPQIRWPTGSIDLQSRIGPDNKLRILKKASTLFMTVFYWGIFKLALPFPGFRPNLYRADVAINADFQKFNDGLMMTVDCTLASIENLKRILAKAADDGIIRYGLQLQDEALITCVVPSISNRDHMHFIDGSGGGYASAANQLKTDN